MDRACKTPSRSQPQPPSPSSARPTGCAFLTSAPRVGAPSLLGFRSPPRRRRQAHLYTIRSPSTATLLLTPAAALALAPAPAAVVPSLLLPLTQQAPMLTLLHLAARGLPLNLALYVLARVVGQRMLTPAGLAHGLYLGSLLWACGGPGVYALCVAFLVVGSALTRLGRARKEAAGIAEKRGGARGPENLWGAAGAAAVCATLAALARSLSFSLHDATSAYAPLLSALPASLEACLWCAYAGAIASKFADTASSEVGKAYGSRTFLVTTWREVPRGTEGAVSLEGTLAGVAAGVVAAALARAVGVLQSSGQVAVVIAAATVANYFESWIGAALQERYSLTNEQVNFLNTSAGAVLAAVGSYLVILAGVS